MDNKPTFKHDFKTMMGLVNIPGAQGYQQALIEVMKHIADKALIKDNVLYVNVKELNEILGNTFEELRSLVDAELKGDSLFNNICNIVKKDAKDRYGIDLDKKDDISNAL